MRPTGSDRDPAFRRPLGARVHRDRAVANASIPRLRYFVRPVTAEPFAFALALPSRAAQAKPTIS